MRKITAATINGRVSRHRIRSGEYRRFDIQAAHDILPMVRTITRQAVEELAPIQRRLNSMVPADPRITRVKNAYERVVKNWVGKIERLGLKVLGLWQVGFDEGTGWNGWQYPERSVRYFLEYDALFADRSLIRNQTSARSRISRK